MPLPEISFHSSPTRPTPAKIWKSGPVTAAGVIGGAAFTASTARLPGLALVGAGIAVRGLGESVRSDASHVVMPAGFS